MWSCCIFTRVTGISNGKAETLFCVFQLSDIEKWTEIQIGVSAAGHALCKHNGWDGGGVNCYSVPQCG